MCSTPACRNRYVNGCQIRNPKTAAYGTSPNHVSQNRAPLWPKSSAESSCSTNTETHAMHIVLIAGGKYSVRSNRWPYPRRKTGLTVPKSKASAHPSQSREGIGDRIERNCPFLCAWARHRTFWEFQTHPQLFYEGFLRLENFVVGDDSDFGFTSLRLLQSFHISVFGHSSDPHAQSWMS